MIILSIVLAGSICGAVTPYLIHASSKDTNTPDKDSGKTKGASGYCDKSIDWSSVPSERIFTTNPQGSQRWFVDINFTITQAMNRTPDTFINHLGSGIYLIQGIDSGEFYLVNNDIPYILIL